MQILSVLNRLLRLITSSSKTILTGQSKVYPYIINVELCWQNWEKLKRLFGAGMLGQNVGRYGVSDELAQEAIKTSISTDCPLSGPKKCLDELDSWYPMVKKRLAKDKSTPQRQVVAN
jgi:hypothetical protein